jgi:hypothetical protein
LNRKPPARTKPREKHLAAPQESMNGPELTAGEIDLLLESIRYSRLQIEAGQNHPEGPEGYRLRKEKLDQLSVVGAKLSAIKVHLTGNR